MARKKTESPNNTSATEPIQGQSEIQWPDFLSREECVLFSKFITGLPLVPTPPPKKGEATRVNHRISFQSKDFASRLYQAISPHLPPLPCSETRATDATPVGCNSNIRLYKYGPGEYFGPHYDESIRDKHTGWWSEWTVLVYVTGHEDGVEGGETIFFKPIPGSKKNTEIVPPLIRGSVLIHRHGHACMLHEGREVKNGTKLVLRSDIMFARTS